MANEKIQAIREAELDAANSLKEAHSKSDFILSEAKKEADKIEKEMLAQIEKEADQLAKEAEQKNVLALEAAIKKAEVDIEKINEVVSSKQAEATKLIMAEII